jgi:hypothetical protein
VIPPCHYITKSMEALYEHRKFFATGVDFDHGGVEQNRRGGGGPGGMFLFTYRTDLLEYFIGKKQIEKHVEVFFGSYDS